jgi:hypothetical protein
MDPQTHLWLGIIAIVSALQFLGLVTVALAIVLKVRRIEAMVEARALRLERATEDALKDLRPVLRKTTAVLDDLSDLAARVRRIDTSVSATVTGVSAGLRGAGQAVLSNLWPAAGVLHAVAAGTRKLRERRRRERLQQDAKDLSGFVNEGGTHG